MRRLTTRQLVNHFGNFPGVKIETPSGFRNIDSITSLRSGDIHVTTIEPDGLSGEVFEIPASDVDTLMWFIR